MLKSVVGKLFGKALPKDLSYEEARNALEKQDTKLRHDLAGREGVEPEILYYLAEDTDPEIRRKVARNPSTPAKADLKLSDDTDDEVRTVLARKVARLVPSLNAMESERIRDIVIETLQKLARDQLPRVRTIISIAVKSSAHVPSDMVRRLAKDEDFDVAKPVLEFSPLLNDADLKELIELARVTDHIQTIAKRHNISPAVCDAIIARADIKAIADLISNKTANISKAALETIVDKAASIEDWHGPLVKRPNLSSRIVRRIAGFVSSALIDQLAERPGLDDDTVNELKSRARNSIGKGELETADKTGDAEKKVAMAEAAGKLNDIFVSNAIESDDREVVILSLAALAKAPVDSVRRLISARSGRAVTALVWKAQLPMRVSVEIQSFMLKLHQNERLLARGGTDFPLGAAEMGTHLDLFGIKA